MNTEASHRPTDHLQMSDELSPPGRITPRARGLYKKEVRALRRYVWMRRACIAISVSLLLAAVSMVLGWF